MPVLARPVTNDFVGPTFYLLFAGLHGEPRRGSGDLVATLASQEAARQAFRQIRLHLADRDGWAELAVVSDGGRTRRLSWFGVDRRPNDNPAAALLDQMRFDADPGRTAGERRWRRRLSMATPRRDRAARADGPRAQSNSTRTT